MPPRSTPPTDALARFADLVIRHRLAIVLATVVYTLALFLPLGWLESDDRIDVWFHDGDDSIVRYREFQETFGNDDFAIAVFEFDDAYADPNLERIERITERIESLSMVDRATSLTNVESIRAGENGGSILVGELIGPLPIDPAKRSRARAQASRDPLLLRYVVSPDSRTTAVVARMLPDLDTESRSDAARTIRAIVTEETGVEPAMTGWPVLDHVYYEMSDRDWARLLPAMLALIVLLHYALFRSWAAVVLPIAGMIVSVLTALAAIGATGTELNILSKGIPLILLAICIASSVHVLHSYRTELRRGLDHHPALHAALVSVARPCVVASATTAIGFASFGFAPLPPVREFGSFAAVGVVASCIFSLTALPAALAFLRPRGLAKATTWEAWPDVWNRIADLAITRRRAIAVIAVLSLCLSFVGVARVRVADNPLDNFPEDAPFVADVALLEDRLFGAESFESILLGDPAVLLAPSTQRRLDEYAAWLRRKPLVERTVSVTDFLKQMNLTFEGGRPEAYTVPDDPELISQFMLLLRGPDAEVESYIATDVSQLRITARMRLHGSQGLSSTVADAREHLAESFPDFETSVTGGGDLLYRIDQNIITAQFQSLAIVVPLLLLTLVVLFRSLSLLPLLIVANLLPVVLTLGFMGLSGTGLNAGTVMVASIALGLVIDDSVYLLDRVIRESRSGRSMDDVLRRSLSHVGPALFCTSIILCMGFAIRGLGEFKPGADLGILTALSLAAAFVCDVVLLPALVSFAPQLVRGRLRPEGEERA